MTTHTLLTPTVLLNDSLMLLRNKSVFIKNINTEYKGKFGVVNEKAGPTVNVRKANRFTVSTTNALDLQGVAEESVPITINRRAQTSFSFTMEDLKLTIDQFRERYLNNAMAAIATHIDRNCLSMYKDVFQATGTFGTAPTTIAGYMAGKQYLRELTGQDTDVNFVLDSATEVAAVNALGALYNSQARLAEQYTTGRMTQALGMNWYVDQNIYRHTNGTWTGTPAVKTTVTTEGATTITLKSFGAPGDTVTQGTILSFGAVNLVNLDSKQSLARNQFVVTADATVDASSEVTLSIYPPMYTAASGGKQTIDAFPLADATVTFRGTTGQSKIENLVFHKDAFTLATITEELPQGVHFAAADELDGVSMRIVRQYDINSNTIPCRIDVLYGFKTIYPELAVRVPGA